MNIVIPPPNPALTPIKARVKTRPWSHLALWPRPPAKPRSKVYLLARDERRFVVCAADRVEADKRLNTLLS